MTPKVSYIMPCSRQRWLAEAITSATKQSLTDIEILVGNSTRLTIDNKDKRVFEINTEGIKLNEAINLLIDCAKSDVICILCDDDVDLPNRAAVILRELEDGSNIVVAGYNKMNIDGAVYAYELPLPWDYDKYVYGGLNMPLWSGGYRKSTTPAWHPDLRFMGDYGFFLESHKRGLKIKTSSEIVANIRHHPGQQSQNTPENMAARNEEKKIIKEIYGIDVKR